jgi:uncharacterized protein (TIGR02284 family)
MRNKVTNKETVAELNRLVEINNDRVEGYKTALTETEDSGLKALFKEMADHSFQNRNELADEILKNGGEPTGGTCTSGKVFRAWMDIKAALTKKDRKAILNSCEFGEDAALDVYEEVLQKAKEQGIRSLILKQKELLQKDHDRIKLLRDSQ